MAKKKRAPEPAVRKSVLVTGGIAVGAALLGFLLMTFLGGGGGSGEGTQTAELATLNGAAQVPIASSAPAPGSDGTVANVLTPGGTDPFVVRVAPSTGATTGSSSSAPAAPQTTVTQTAPTSGTYVPPPTSVQQQPQGEGPPPAEEPTQAPAPTAQTSSGPATITVLSVYGNSADIRIDDTVFEGAHANDALNDRFSVDEFSGDCFFMKDLSAEGSSRRFQLCANDSVTR